MKRKVFALLIWLVSFSGLSQNDSTYQVVGESVDIEFLKDGIVNYYKHGTKKPINGWVKYYDKSQIDLFRVKNGKRDGAYFSYQKASKSYYLSKYKIYSNDLAKESISFKSKGNELTIKETSIYNLTCDYRGLVNCALLWVNVSYKKNGYKVTITYKYGDKGKTQEVKYWLQELNKLTTPISLKYFKEANMPEFFETESDIPLPPK